MPFGCKMMVQIGNKLTKNTLITNKYNFYYLVLCTLSFSNCDKPIENSKVIKKHNRKFYSKCVYTSHINNGTLKIISKKMEIAKTK